MSSAHLPQVLEWRNSDAVKQNMLNQNAITLQEHLQWFDRACQLDSEYHFIIAFNNQEIGAANLKLLGNNCAEAGLYLCDEKVKGSAYAFLPSLMLLEFAFNTLGVEKIKAVVLPHNQAAIRFNQNQGYEITKSTTELIQMQVAADNFEQRKRKLYRFFDR